MLVSAIAPVASFAETVGNVGNGVDSNSSATVNSNNSTTVSQSNAASVTNTVSVKSNTGGNTANRNTGGEVKVDTGDASAKVGITNVANSNVANVAGCCTNGGSSSVLNSGNGDSSDNTAKLNKNNSTALSQNNVADIANFVSVDSNTGKNEANRNTGGDVSVKTGNSDVNPIIIKNQANQNSAVVGSPMGSAVGAGDLTIGNAGNGVESRNDATANLNNSSAAYQTNVASVLNWVDVTSNTGKNDANRNTGGEVMVDTGDSAVAVGLDTKVNSNAAWLDNCGCVGVGDLVVKNLGNGDSTYNDATVNKNNTTAAAQENLSEVANFGYFDTNTGENDANRNTGAVYGYSDPAVYTGGADAVLSSSTAANNNVLNNGFVTMTPAPTPVGSGNGYWWNWGYGYNGSMSY